MESFVKKLFDPMKRFPRIVWFHRPLSPELETIPTVEQRVAMLKEHLSQSMLTYGLTKDELRATYGAAPGDDNFDEIAERIAREAIAVVDESRELRNWVQRNYTDPYS